MGFLERVAEDTEGALAELAGGGSRETAVEGIELGQQATIVVGIASTASVLAVSLSAVDRRELLQDRPWHVVRVGLEADVDH